MKSFKEYLEEIKVKNYHSYSGVGYRPGQKKTDKQKADHERLKQSQDAVYDLAAKIRKQKKDKN